MATSFSESVKKVFILRPTMGQGGADRVTLLLLQTLDRSRFANTLVLMRKEGEYVADIPADVPVISLDARSMWTAWWPAARLLRHHRPDIIFSTSSGTNILASLAHWLTRSKSRLVLSERNVLEHGGLTAKRRLVIAFKRALYGRADLVTTISDCLRRDTAAKLGLPAGSIFVVYNPVVEANLAQQVAESLTHPWFQDGQTPVILGVGRLVPQKDFTTLIRAFRLVRDRRPARLVILGEGPQRPQLERLVEELRLADDVQFPGFDKNPFRYMARAALFVQTPIHEGLGNVLIQAMACGTAVISTDCPCGPSEIITRPGEDGLLVPVGDPAALAEQIIRLLDDPGLRQHSAVQGQISAQRFTVEKIVKRYEAAITGELDPFLED